ncbi:hypothetical protein E2C01_072755 [Portunus trituberculatus]|uniref:Uncharacterized protein n=1 Tax=Portunus trituberculatus TaxID=210409 RepID=A0A5B7I0X0_PORTR|nr:hypothetical protein [Portunus trituberculatus]
MTYGWLRRLGAVVLADLQTKGSSRKQYVTNHGSPINEKARLMANKYWEATGHHATISKEGAEREKRKPENTTNPPLLPPPRTPLERNATPTSFPRVHPFQQFGRSTVAITPWRVWFRMVLCA